MTARIKPYFECDGGPLYGYTFTCPGCKDRHYIPTSPRSQCRWTFNGSVERPTFSPSILVNEVLWPDGSIGFIRCHFFVRDGRIEFCSDSKHEMAGQTVELAEIEPSGVPEQLDQAGS